MRLLPFLLCLPLLAGCAEGNRLVAEFGPQDRYTLDKGEWYPRAKLEPGLAPDKHFADLDKANIVRVGAGDHDVLLFGRDDEDLNIRAWVELDHGRVVASGFWARTWDTETTWHHASEGSGTCGLEGSDPDEMAGTLELRFPKGTVESARGGPSGPVEFRVSGRFKAERKAPR